MDFSDTQHIQSSSSSSSKPGGSSKSGAIPKTRVAEDEFDDFVKGRYVVVRP